MMIKYELPDFSKWDSYYINCVKKDLALDYDLKDNTVQYTYGITISPNLKKLDKEYQILSKALEEENGDFLNRYFASFKFCEMRVEYDGNYDWLDDLKSEIQLYYSGEKWGIVNDFFISTYKDAQKGYITYGDLHYFPYIPPYPDIYSDTLNFFNALSFENTTSLIKLHIICKKLKEIEKLSYSFKSLPENYNKLFVHENLVAIHPDISKNIDRIISKANKFQKEYQIEHKDYFNMAKECDEISKEAIIFRYKNVFEAYFGKILTHYTYMLEQEKLIGRCDYCDDYFHYVRGKKYCCFADEGKDCGKSARNRRFYSKHKEKILPKARKTTQELRAFYREKGVKK